MYYSNQLFVKKGPLGSVWVGCCCVLLAKIRNSFSSLPANFQLCGTIGYRKVAKKIIMNSDIKKIWSKTHIHTDILSISLKLILLCLHSRTIKQPPGPLALPAQSTLLRGVARIEHQLTLYLLQDATEAKGRLVFFEPSHIDLDKKHRRAR